MRKDTLRDWPPSPIPNLLVDAFRPELWLPAFQVLPPHAHTPDIQDIASPLKNKIQQSERWISSPLKPVSVHEAPKSCLTIGNH